MLSVFETVQSLSKPWFGDQAAIEPKWPVKTVEGATDASKPVSGMLLYKAGGPTGPSVSGAGRGAVHDLRSRN